MTTDELIATAKRLLENDPDGPNLAACCLRDLPEINEAGLNDLAWLLSRDGYCSKNDAIGLIENLETFLALKAQEKG